MLLAGCEAGNDEHDHPATATGKDLYELHCAGCHGMSGRGSLMQGIPSNLLTDFTRTQVVELIIAGPKHEQSNMPAMKTMPRDEARVIVDYLWQLRAQLEQNHDERAVIIKPKSN